MSNDIFGPPRIRDIFLWLMWGKPHFYIVCVSLSVFVWVRGVLLRPCSVRECQTPFAMVWAHMAQYGCENIPQPVLKMLCNIAQTTFTQFGIEWWCQVHGEASFPNVYNLANILFVLCVIALLRGATTGNRRWCSWRPGWNRSGACICS